MATPRSPRIRPPRFSDTPAVYRVCFETGYSAEDIAALRPTPEFLGHVWAGPYLAFAPAWCRVIVDERGVAGYLLAVPDTDAFDAWAERDWWPVLREEHPQDAALSPADQRVAALFASPPRPPRGVADAYPAHLHIDVLERARGAGFARRLIDDLCDRLAASGVPGVHLGVGERNENAIGVYRHLGFTELDRGPGTIWMGRPSSLRPVRGERPGSRRGD